MYQQVRGRGAEFISRCNQEKERRKKSLSLISDLEEDCAVTKSEHLQTEFIL
jgi:hypothetical protein